MTEEAGGIQLWGTPWHSSAGTASAADGPLRMLVFPRRGPGAKLSPISPALAVRRILRTIGLPFWDPVATDYSLGLIDRIVTSLPCFEFAYTPSDGAGVELVGGLLRH